MLSGGGGRVAACGTGFDRLNLANSWAMCKRVAAGWWKKMLLRWILVACFAPIAMIDPVLSISTRTLLGLVGVALLAPPAIASESDEDRAGPASKAPAAASTSTSVSTSTDGPRVIVPVQPRHNPEVYPWKRNIMATVFWVGEKPTANNPTTNVKSSWDTEWKRNFGGYDDPNRRNGHLPKGFIPRQNPFYIALPYNDLVDWRRHKPEAAKVIPWFHRAFERPGRSVLKGRWVAIRRNGRTVYAQWEDCGPFQTDDWRYVFGDQPQPSTDGNGGAGIDLSPAVRDYLGMTGNARVDWRFVELNEVPDGPWRNWGDNNDFVQMREQQSTRRDQRYADVREDASPHYARD